MWWGGHDLVSKTMRAECELTAGTELCPSAQVSLRCVWVGGGGWMRESERTFDEIIDTKCIFYMWKTIKQITLVLNNISMLWWGYHWKVLKLCKASLFLQHIDLPFPRAAKTYKGVCVLYVWENVLCSNSKVILIVIILYQAHFTCCWVLVLKWWRPTPGRHWLWQPVNQVPHTWSVIDNPVDISDAWISCQLDD